MKIKYAKEEEIKMVKFLRFRNQDPRTCRFTCMAVKDIARLVSKSSSYVSAICGKLCRESAAVVEVEAPV